MSHPLSQSQKHAEQLVHTVQHQCHTALASLQRTWEDRSARPKLLLYVGLTILASLWLGATLILRLRTRQRQLEKPPSTPDLEKRSPFKATERKPGGTL